MAVAAPICSSTVAVSPSAPAATNPASDTPATGALRISATLTRPSASAARSVACAGKPDRAGRLAGQLAIGLAQGKSAAALLRGVGAPFAKSAALLSLSAQPPPARRAAVVLVRLGDVGPAPSKAEAVPP